MDKYVNEVELQKLFLRYYGADVEEFIRWGGNFTLKMAPLTEEQIRAVAEFMASPAFPTRKQAPYPDTTHPEPTPCP